MTAARRASFMHIHVQMHSQRNTRTAIGIGLGLVARQQPPSTRCEKRSRYRPHKLTIMVLVQPAFGEGELHCRARNGDVLQVAGQVYV